VSASARAGAADGARAARRERVFVVGAGLMGAGIAAQCAVAGFGVTLEDLSEELVQRGRSRALRALDHARDRGELDPAGRDAAAARIVAAVGLQGAGAAEVIVEAAPEDLGLKRKLFAELERLAPRQAVLASNTSSLPIASIGTGLSDPGRLVGLHFFNPVLQMPLVELIAGAGTREEVVGRARRFATDLGKTVVRSADTPGFVTSRAVAVLINEAARMLEEHVAEPADIDTAYRLGFHHPMGPFELVDLVGIDTTVAILDVLYAGLHDERYRASPVLRAKVAAGKLGRKAGEGFYAYPPRGAKPG
jgi:3-hydroxybutyryl-CoA dehydrogenase